MQNDRPDKPLVTEELEGSDERPNKTAGKREDAKLEALAARLADLPISRIDYLPLDADFRAALAEHRRITSHEAKRRHLRRLRKLLRAEEFDSLTNALDRLDPSSALAMQATQAAQRWSDRLLDDGRAGMTAAIEAYPGLDSQRLGQLVRKASKQRKAAQSAALVPAQRELLRFLREVILRTE